MVKWQSVRLTGQESVATIVAEVTTTITTSYEPDHQAKLQINPHITSYEVISLLLEEEP